MKINVEHPPHVHTQTHKNKLLKRLHLKSSQSVTEQPPRKHKIRDYATWDYGGLGHFKGAKKQKYNLKFTNIN